MYPSISIKGKSRSQASLRSLFGYDYTETCDKCDRGIDNGCIEWMGISFLSFDGRFLCPSCRCKERAQRQASLEARIALAKATRKISMSKRLW